MGDRRTAVLRTKDPAQWDIDTLIQALGALDDQTRTGALSVFAHHLTVEIRMLLSDPPFTEPVRTVNEFEHHLTRRLHPDGLRPPDGDISLLSDIAADAARCGLTPAVKRGLVTAARNALVSTKKSVAAQ